MSSVNWDKTKTASEAKAKIRHNDKEERVKTEHSNPDINKDLTSKNLSLDGRSYEEKCRAYDKRVEWCKGNMKRVRKDAVTMIGLNVKLPEGLVHAPYEKQVEWCQDVYAIMQDFVGKDNIVSATADFDEVHEYYNPETKQKELSRPEVDIRFVPEIEGKLNAKKWQTKGNMTRLNNLVQEMTQDKYHMDFMTGKGGKNVSTEVLKAQSAKAEAEQAKLEVQRAAKNVKLLEKSRDNAIRSKTSAETAVKDARKSLTYLTSTINLKQARKTSLEGEISDLEAQVEESRRRAEKERQRANTEFQRVNQAKIDKLERDRRAFEQEKLDWQEQVQKQSEEWSLKYQQIDRERAENRRKSDLLDDCIQRVQKELSNDEIIEQTLDKAFVPVKNQLGQKVAMPARHYEERLRKTRDTRIRGVNSERINGMIADMQGNEDDNDFSL